MDEATLARVMRDRICRCAQLRAQATHLWPCGCLPNKAGAHRVGCPEHPQGNTATKRRED